MNTECQELLSEGFSISSNIKMFYILHLLNTGLITQRAKDACDNVNGHTSEIAKKHYLLKSRQVVVSTHILFYLYDNPIIYMTPLHKEDTHQAQLISQVIALPGNSDTPTVLPARIRDGTLQGRSYSYRSKVNKALHVYIIYILVRTHLLLTCHTD